MSTSNILIIPCSSCNQPLNTPIISLNDCRHYLHKHCYEKLTQPDSVCPKCTTPITGGVEDTEIKATMDKIDRLAIPFINSVPRRLLFDYLLHNSIQNNETDIAVALMGRVESVSSLIDGRSPLYRACEKGNLTLAERLLKLGADANQKNDFRGLTDRGIPLPLKHPHGSTPMRAAAESGNIDLVKLLLAYRASIDEPDSEGNAPVFVALDASNEDLALFFIEMGAKFAVKNSDGISLLRCACKALCLKFVQELINRGADVTEKDEDGHTLLHEAAEKNSPTLLPLLLQTDAKRLLNDLWLKKWTPLSMAVKSGLVENVRILVEAGADLSIKYPDSYGIPMTLLDLAKTKKVEDYLNNYRLLIQRK